MYTTTCERGDGGGYVAVLETAMPSLKRASILLLETNLVTIYVMFEKQESFKCLFEDTF